MRCPADLLPTSNSHETRYMNVTFLWKLKRSSMNKKTAMAPQGQATKDWKNSAVSVRQVRRGKKCLWRQHRHTGPDCHVLSKVTLAATLTSACLLPHIFRRWDISSRSVESEMHHHFFWGQKCVPTFLSSGKGRFVFSSPRGVSYEGGWFCFTPLCLVHLGEMGMKAIK